MATTTPKQRQLARALTRLKALQDAGGQVYRSTEFKRSELTALVDAGFLQMVVKGWYIASVPGAAPADTTPWHAAMRAFLSGYCDQRFGETWHVAPGYSVQLHAGATTTPSQVIVHTPEGNNQKLELPGGCSLVAYQAREWPAADQIERVDGVRVLSLPAALARVPERFFRTSPTDAQIALAQLRDASDLNRILLEGNHRTAAGRLAGALRAIGRADMANDVRASLQAAGHVVTEVNPFTVEVHVLNRSRAVSPYVQRMQLMWWEMRPAVESIVPPAPGLPAASAPYLQTMEEVYRTDAYHSLSIEGYRVSDELIQRVATGAWDPKRHAGDADARNAMAAHGYWRAFNSVKASVQRILAGEDAAAVVARDHGAWYRQLFGPSVEAGLLRAGDLAGYRNAPVYIKNATHVPPSSDAARDMMPVLFELLGAEPHAGVRAVLGHFLFVFVHPYMDGNGRMGRFLMNTMLASGGYPWTIIRVERRADYMAALDAASARGDIAPFAEFIASSIRA